MRSVKPQKVRNIEETCVEKCILENVRNGRGGQACSEEVRSDVTEIRVFYESGDKARVNKFLVGTNGWCNIVERLKEQSQRPYDIRR